jgi:hypothetical protein
MIPRVLFNYAINTGKLYEQHCTMAREGASLRVWQLHVTVNVLPAFKKENDEPYEGLSRAEVEMVGGELRAYYVQHMEESDGA